MHARRASPHFAVLFALLAACQAIDAGEGQQHFGGHEFHNELTITAGEFNEADENGSRVGVDYERRAPEGWGVGLDERWGFGVMADWYSKKDDSLFVAAQSVYHPIEPVSLIVALGFDSDTGGSTGEAESYVLRLGSRYTFSLNERLGFGPEIFYDVLEGGKRRGVFAFALTWPF